MSGHVQVCCLEAGLGDRLRAFKFAKSLRSRALILKVDPGRKLLVVDGDDMDDVRVDDLPEALPEHQPRFVLLNYRWDHGDGRVSYPLCLVFSTPRDCKTELQMMYAGSKLSLVKEAGVTKVYELRDPEELTEQWLLEQLTLRM